MKNLLILPAICMMMVSACEQETSTDISTPSKLLLSIKENGKISTKFIYDDKNKLIRIDHYGMDSLNFSDFFEYDKFNRLFQKTSDNTEMVETVDYSEGGSVLATEKYYAPTRKTWREVYEYKGTKIVRAETFFNGQKSGYVEYKYDKNGNTIERTEYSTQEGMEDFIMYQLKLKYDNKVNPFMGISKFPVDIVHNNNPVYSFYLNTFMSSLPPETSSTFEYDDEGLPVKEYRGESVIEYEYH